VGLPPKTKENLNVLAAGVDPKLAAPAALNVMSQIQNVGKAAWCDKFRPIVGEMEQALRGEGTGGDLKSDRRPPHQGCVRDWTACVDNADLVNHYSGMAKARTMCAQEWWWQQKDATAPNLPFNLFDNLGY
jgi:hypothetical protein